MEVKLPNPKYIARPYEQMQYPGQRVQKEKSFINTPPLTNTSDFAIQRLLRSIAATALAMFLKHLQKRFPFKLECVQTDNGQDFTKRLGNTENPTPTLFEARPEQCGIKTNSQSPTHRDITARLSVATAKITNIFMLHILFTLLTILNNNFLFTTETTTTFLCVRLIGNLLLII